MAITLGTNIPSYNARVNLNSVSDQLTKTMEKLSTGLKINRASDDAAGLVISENMEALIRGSKQAQANIQTASSFLTVAEDGMVSISDHLQRINDLLVNMANDTNSTTSRKASAQEIVERLDEVNRLADSTNFNGKTMLDGSVDSIIVQMGTDETDLSIIDISKSLTDCHVTALGSKLPGYLNPEALTALDGRVIIPNDDGTGYVYEEDGKPFVGATADLESAFDPTNENCRTYIANVQKAIDGIASRRGLLGAYENRMQSSYDSMTTRIESLEAAKTVYTDTDIAEEATKLTRDQIMQQVNTSILATANTLPQLALSLLG